MHSLTDPPNPVKRPPPRLEPRCSECESTLVDLPYWVGGIGWVFRLTCPRCAAFGCDGGPHEVQR